MIVGASKPAIGRTILEEYDLILDARSERIIVLPKFNITPTRPLMKYRLDAEFSNDLTSESWRWVPSIDRINQGDFVFLGIDETAAQFVLTCLSKGCEDHVIPFKGKQWVGAPTVEVDSSGAVTVRETVGWEGYAIDLSESMQIVTIAISRTGFRMKLDAQSIVKGSRMELVPVEGAREIGEFSLSEWPPVFDSAMMEIGYITADDERALILDNAEWHGLPKFEIIEGNRIVVTAQALEDACDRRILFFGSAPGPMYIDFGTEICAYRQYDIGEAGYLFRRIGRSEYRSEDALRITIRHGSVSFQNYGGLYLDSSTQPDNVWSPDIRWLAAPVVTVDPQTREITIRPTGEAGWEYTHEWRRCIVSGGTSLIFNVLPKHSKRLLVSY